MIDYKLIEEIEPQVSSAVRETFDRAILNQKNPNDFVLFLENGHVMTEQIKGLSKYIIGTGLKGIADYDRHDFFKFYLNIPFSEAFAEAKDKNKKEEILKNSLHLELMIYTHHWEAYPNLRILKQLVNLTTKEPYEWELELPDFGKQNYIRETIRDTFKNNNLKIADIIKKSFNGQLRNAFAHSQYSFFVRDKIELHNYRGKPWEKEFITYEEWNQRFHTTALLFDSLSKEIDNYKRQIGLENKEQSVWIPSENGYKLNHLYYDKYWNRFIWHNDDT